MCQNKTNQILYYRHLLASSIQSNNSGDQNMMKGFATNRGWDIRHYRWNCWTAPVKLFIQLFPTEWKKSVCSFFCKIVPEPLLQILLHSAFIIFAVASNTKDGQDSVIMLTITFSTLTPCRIALQIFLCISEYTYVFFCATLIVNCQLYKKKNSKHSE